MSKIMSVGGYNPSKIAVGVSLDANGKVQINNPKVDKIIGSIVEPHDDSYKGLVAVLGANCIANVSLAFGSYCTPFKDGNTYVIGAANYIYILDQNLNIIKSRVSNGGGSIFGCYADNDHVYTIRPSATFRIEKHNKADLTFVKGVEAPVASVGFDNSAGFGGPITLVSDSQYLYSIMRGNIVKYDKELNLVASKDLSKAPVSATVTNQYQILGVHNKKLIFSLFISATQSRLFSVDMDTLTVTEIGTGVIAISSFIEGENVVSVSRDRMEITNILTGVKTSHSISGNFGYPPQNISGVSNGKYVVPSGDSLLTSNVLEVREISTEDGYESRVYRIKLDSSIRKTHIDDIGRVWVMMGNGSVMLLNDELTLKGYRIV